MRKNKLFSPTFSIVEIRLDEEDLKGKKIIKNYSVFDV